MHGCGGACVVAPGGGAGVRGCSGGACMAAPRGGHAWLLLEGRAWLLPGGMCGEGGHAWRRGACMVKGACVVKGGGMRSMHGRSLRGRYASYWNAFLFSNIFVKNCIKMKEISPGYP